MENNNLVEKLTKVIIYQKQFESSIFKIKEETIKKVHDILCSFFNCSFEVFIIDKTIEEEYKKKINYKELANLDKNNIKIQLKKYLEKNPYNFDANKIKIYHDINEIQQLLDEKKEFSFISKNTLKYLGVPKEEYDKKNLNYFRTKNKTYLMLYNNNQHTILKISTNQSNLEIEKNSLEQLNKENHIQINAGNDRRLELLILIYAQKNNIRKILKNDIRDEYDFNKYYLVNKKWYEEYLKVNEFSKISYELDKENYDLSYKGFKHNLKNIIEEKNLNDIFEVNKNEKNLIDLKKIKPIIKKYECNNEYELKELNNIDLLYPDDFELINEEIYNMILEKNPSKNVFDKEILQYQALIGENLIIIKNKIKNIFLIYTLNNKEEYSLDYILLYKDNSMFYNDLNKYIKKKGGIGNFIGKRKLEEDEKPFKELIDNQKSIGIFINMKILRNNSNRSINIKKNFKDCFDESDNILMNETKRYIYVIKKYKDFLNSLEILEPLSETGETISLKEIEKKIKNTNNYLSVCVLDGDSLLKFKQIIDYDFYESICKENENDVINEMYDKIIIRDDIFMDTNIKYLDKIDNCKGDEAKKHSINLIDSDIYELIEKTENKNQKIFYFVCGEDGKDSYLFFSEERQIIMLIKDQNTENLFYPTLQMYSNERYSNRTKNK